MTRAHHVVAATWRAREVFLLWYTNDEDGLLTDGAGRLPGVGELTAEDRRAIATVLRHGLTCFDAALR